MLKKTKGLMIFVFLLNPWASCLVSAHVASSESQVKTQAMVQLRQLLEKTVSMEAHFTQTILGPNHEQVGQQSGHCWIKRPGLLRWEQKNPSHLLISDGRYLWDYDPDLLQVIQTKIKSSFHKMPLYLLFQNSEGIEKHFTLLKYKSPDQKQAQFVFELKPKNEDQGFSALQVIFDRQAQLRRLQFIDQLGQTICLEFSKTIRNQPMRSTLFQFKVPSGVDLIQNH